MREKVHRCRSERPRWHLCVCSCGISLPLSGKSVVTDYSSSFSPHVIFTSTPREQNISGPNNSSEYTVLIGRGEGGTAQSSANAIVEIHTYLAAVPEQGYWYELLIIETLNHNDLSRCKIILVYIWRWVVWHIVADGQASWAASNDLRCWFRRQNHNSAIECSFWQVI